VKLGIWIAGVVFAVAGAIGVWARWLTRRRVLWFTRLNDSIPVNSDWWRRQRERHGDLLYVAIGDSAAQGIGASKPSRSYVGQLASRLRDTTGRTVRVVNLAVSGATVGSALREQVPLLERLEPDLLTVSIGANDIADWDPERFEREYRELLERLPDHAIVADLPSFYVLPGRRSVAVGNRIIERLAAERGMPTVELHARTARQGGWGMMTQFAGDLFHPNDRGYKVWADAFWPAVSRRAASIESRSDVRELGARATAG
jgi:acyl-CoA thioesterase-1